ncbi:hypothetical protein [Halorussus salinus]|nr:hypothetical protein [Halorussus salinus]
MPNVFDCGREVVDSGTPRRAGDRLVCQSSSLPTVVGGIDALLGRTGD